MPQISLQNGFWAKDYMAIFQYLQNVEKLNGAGIAQIECGAQFSLALSKSGLVWTWGKGDYFRLGHGADQESCSSKSSYICHRSLSSLALCPTPSMVYKSQRQISTIPVSKINSI